MSPWPAIDIINGTLAGLFSKVEIVDPTLKFKGVLVDPMEVREVLSREREAGRVGVDEATRILGMTRFGVSTLAKLRTLLGEPYLRERHFENAKGVRMRLFALEELQIFVRDHISLMEYARSLSFPLKVMKRKLDANGIEPITGHMG